MEQRIKMILDKSVLDNYNSYYFKLHPKAKKVPIEKPWHPSINQWCILPRIQMNALKQKWKEFGVWWIKELGYEGMKLDNFEVTQTIYFDSKRRHDIDNYTAKFLNDSWTEAGFIVDDDSEHYKKITMQNSYDKEHPRTEIEIKILN